MKSPKFPMNEAERVASLCRLGILDTDPEERFDRLTRIARACFNVPIALVSLVDSDRQWFKSKQGLDAAQTPRDISFCGHAVLDTDIFCIPDALEDQRFADNPLVAGPPHVRFYAGAPLILANGAAVGTLCIIDSRPRRLNKAEFQVLRDIADSVQHELRQIEIIDAAHILSMQESRLRAVLNTVLDGIISISGPGTIETFNPAAERIFGYSANEVIGKNVKCLMPEPYHSAHDGYLANYHKTGEAKIIGIGREVVGRRKDGSLFPMELAVSEVKVDDELLFTGVVHDITERKMAEKTKSEFISTVSHELRTPLTSIKGSLGLVQSGALGTLPDKLKSMVDIAYKNCNRLVILINDILDIEKIEAGRMSFNLVPMDLGKLLKVAIEANRGYGNEFDVSLALSLPEGRFLVNGDSNRLMQVMANFLSNAIKFSPPSGTVEVTLSPSNGGFRVAVSDSGPGIPASFKNQIFGKFRQADSSDTRQKGGTGLGLNIAKAIVENHSGTIGFQTEENVGTTFFFDLPKLATAQGSSLLQGAEETRKPKLLICENDTKIAEFLQSMIEKAGYGTAIAQSADEAKNILSGGGFDVMTLDVGLPDQKSFSLVRELREQTETKALPILMISADIDGSKNALNGDAVDIVDWLQKPIDQQLLTKRLRESLQNFSEKRPRLLYVEDDADLIRVVSALMEDRVDVVAATTLAEATSRLGQEDFDLVVLDLMLPDGSGESLLPRLKNLNGKSLPVIIFSGKDVSHETAESVNAALLKSQTSNEDLLKTILSTIARN